MEILADGIIWYIVFLFSTTLHEASHAFTSMKLGDSTAYEGGQVTLNPFPHVRREPFGTVVIPVISFFLAGWMIGWASAPYDPNWAFRYPKKSAMMAFAGPLSNLALVVIAALLIHLGISLDILLAPGEITFSTVVEAVNGGIFTGVAKFLSILFSLNLILFIFNLIPVPPLDGSGIIPFLLKDDLARKYMGFIHSPGLMFVGIIIAWKIFDFIFPDVHLFAINLLYPGTNYGFN